MKRQTSLGDVISALYDTVDPTVGLRSASEVVAACTLELLWRQRKQSIIAALLATPDLVFN